MRAHIKMNIFQIFNPSTGFNNHKKTIINHTKTIHKNKVVVKEQATKEAIRSSLEARMTPNAKMPIFLLMNQGIKEGKKRIIITTRKKTFSA